MSNAHSFFVQVFAHFLHLHAAHACSTNFFSPDSILHQYYPMSEPRKASYVASGDQEESFFTALVDVTNRSQKPLQPSAKMFMITDTSPASPLVKQRSLHSPHGKAHQKQQLRSPTSYTSAITQSPAVSQSATSDEPNVERSHVNFHSVNVHASASGAPKHSHTLLSNTNSTALPQANPHRLESQLQSPNISKNPLPSTGPNQTPSAHKGALAEFGTPTLVPTKSSTRKPAKSIVADFTPPPSKIPTRKRRTPSYARSTKASKRRSQWTKMSSAQRESDKHTNGPKATRLNFSNTIPVSPEVLHRKTGRVRKLPSPKKRTGFKPNPPPRYLYNHRPLVRPTAKSEAVLLGRVRAPPAPSPPSFAQREPVPTVSKPFNLGSVDLHDIRVQQIQARRKTEEEEDRRRRNVHPVKLHREILDGPTFVPNLDNKVQTVPVDPVPWAAERRERTLAFEAAQRVRIAEMDAMKEQAQKMRELAEEERLREEYERKRFRPRPVPRSHYEPDTPPTRRASLALTHLRDVVAVRTADEDETELRNFFSKLGITNDTQTSSTRQQRDREVKHSLSLKLSERKDLYSIVEQEHNATAFGDKSEIEAIEAIDEAGKENIVPKSMATHRSTEIDGKQRRESGLGPMRLFTEIRNTLLGRP
eukprot:TRINITY_DN3567_c0_g1_i1.p1 TRINITY_DN3567_c0_g1~~TRINITY_DN3567_c0_g1_i1.p1  ORF type:complete len:647 (-),score=100.18 TRINITY_DN3567_c0_g1_i1:187-2127(-)